MYKFLKKHLTIYLFLPFVFIALLLSRFFYLDFGLPYVQQADEIEMVEYSLKYAVNLNKFFEGDLHFFKPFSFVYGSLPAYMNTILLVPFLKFTSFFELSQDRYYIYLYLRIIYAIFSILTCIGVYLVAKQVSKNKIIAYLSAILFSLNFYFLWLSKYLNNDILIVLFTVYFVYFYLRFNETLKKRFLYLSMIFVGLGVATKITFLIVLIYPIFDLILKKSYKKLSISLTIVFFVYLITNPFTFIYPNEFIGRILEMRVKENGVVIDSYNTSVFKYLSSLIDNLTALVAVLGFVKILKDIKEKKFDITASIVIIFVVFFSISNRLVDRWVLPIYPFLIINFFIVTFTLQKKYFKEVVFGITFFITIGNFIQTNIELSLDSTMKNAYLDFKDKYFENGKSIYLVTERGMNPFYEFSKKGMIYDQARLNLYVSEGGFESFPENPSKYDYIVFSSKVRNYYLNPYIVAINPDYSYKWESFFRELLKPENFELISFYGSDMRSSINQENIYIFKKKTSN